MVCRKLGYPSEAAAEEAMFDHWRRARPGKLPCRTYPCPHCPGKYHLTSEPKRA